MNEKQSNKLSIKSSYDGSLESEDDFNLTIDSIESNCSIQSNYYQKVMSNQKEQKDTFLNDSGDDLHLQTEFDSINKQFYSEQIECKKEFDLKSAHFMKLVHSNDTHSDENNQLEIDFNLEDNKTINYINYFKLNSRLGQLRTTLNFELLFFMNLKSLRLNYTNKLEEVKKQFSTQFEKTDVLHFNNETTKLECLNCKQINLRYSTDTLLSESDQVKQKSFKKSQKKYV